MSKGSASAKAAAIARVVEEAKGPVGPGHHNAHRTAHIEAWVKAHPKETFMPGTRRKKRRES